jgi:hypothetical protein
MKKAAGYAGADGEKITLASEYFYLAGTGKFG